MKVKKRHIIILLMVLYVVSKVYVSYTVNPNDDDLPDRVKDIVLRVAMINVDKLET